MGDQRKVLWDGKMSSAVHDASCSFVAGMKRSRSPRTQKVAQAIQPYAVASIPLEVKQANIGCKHCGGGL